MLSRLPALWACLLSVAFASGSKSSGQHAATTSQPSGPERNTTSKWTGIFANATQQVPSVTSQPTVIYTAAPWLQESDQTTVYLEEVFTVQEQIITKTFAVCVPASTVYPTITITSNCPSGTAAPSPGNGGGHYSSGVAPSASGTVTKTEIWESATSETPTPNTSIITVTETFIYTPVTTTLPGDTSVHTIWQSSEYTGTTEYETSTGATDTTQDISVVTITKTWVYSPVTTTLTEGSSIETIWQSSEYATSTGTPIQVTSASSSPTGTAYQSTTWQDTSSFYHFSNTSSKAMTSTSPATGPVGTGSSLPSYTTGLSSSNNSTYSSTSSITGVAGNSTSSIVPATTSQFSSVASTASSGVENSTSTQSTSPSVSIVTSAMSTIDTKTTSKMSATASSINSTHPLSTSSALSNKTSTSSVSTSSSGASLTSPMSSIHSNATSQQPTTASSLSSTRTLPTSSATSNNTSMSSMTTSSPTGNLTSSMSSMSSSITQQSPISSSPSTSSAAMNTTSKYSMSSISPTVTPTSSMTSSTQSQSKNSTMPPNSSSSSASSASSTSSTSSSVPSSTGVCTPVAAGAPITQPSGSLLQVGPDDAPYDLSQSSLLDSISFPNGLECRENLIILFPGTAVPALDTFTSTFIPVFKDASVADADVMVVSNPSVSLGDASTTAEYAAFAINYAALVLGRKATILAWSQGNLNTQWALKYWPSTWNNVKNYVAISPDYDGTLDASFLCDPEKLLSSNLATLAENFLTDDGLGTDLSAILGVGALPTSAEQFRLYLLALLSGDMPEMLANATAQTGGAPSTATASSTTAAGLDGLLGGLTNIIPTTAPVLKRAVPFGTPGQVADSRAIETAIHKRTFDHVKRQGTGGNPSALVQLVAGLAGPIVEALISLAAQPVSVLDEVLQNAAGNLADVQIPTVLPQGCLPGIWQQTYFSNFVNTLATDYGNGAGDSAFVPTTTVFSLTDEVVEPQGATGFEAASGYLKNASNIFIQGNGGCPIVASTLISGLPTVITHEGVLYSGMGVAVAVEAVKRGGEVTVDMIDATTRCDLVSPLLTAQQAIAQEATIPGALARVLFGGADQTLATAFLPAEPAIKAYATIAH